MRRVIIESPDAGDVDVNVGYARRAIRDALARGESPIASYLLLTQSDAIPDERSPRMDSGHAWLEVADACVAYTDLGISDGMWRGIEAARQAGVPVEFRKLGRLTIRLLHLAGRPANRSA